MIDGLKPYPAYKDSGMPWLGQVPEHWEVRRLRHAVEMRVSNVDKHSKDGEHPVRLCNYTHVYKNERIGAGLSFMPATATRDEIDRFRLRLGDVLITKDSEAWHDIGVPSLVAHCAPDLICGYHLAILRFRTDLILGSFLWRALQSVGVAYQFHIAANGVTRYGLSHDAIKNILIPLPPISEQNGISRFLGYIDRRITRYIRAKKKLIALLNEQKHGIIHHAVTRGLDPNVRLKRSGVEWLGDVPEDWEVRRLRHCGSIVGGMTPSMNERKFWGGTIPWITPKDMKRFVVTDSEERITDVALDLTSLRLIPSGAVLLVVRGMILARIVPVALAVTPVTINQDMKALIPYANVDSEFLALCLTTARNAFVPLIDEAGHGTKRLPTERWRQLELAFPPWTDQTGIVHFLNTANRTLDSAIDTAEREVSLLLEFRTRLIADVVTGKLDVREAAARLPEEPEEAEPLDDSDAIDDLDAAGEDGEPEPDEALEEAVA